ncbi:MAG: AI-2E family transporter [Candidatus Woesearchaeota archaeon]
MKDRQLVGVLLTFISIVLAGFILKELAFFLRPFVVAIILTFLIIPSQKIIQKKKVPIFITKNTVRWASLILFVLTVLILSFYAQNIGPNAVFYIGKTGSFLSEVDDLMFEWGIESNFSDLLLNSNTSILIEPILRTSASLISELFLIMIFTVFLILSYNTILNNVTKLYSPSKKAKINSIIHHIESGIIKYLGSKILISIGTAFVSVFILYFFVDGHSQFFGVMFFALNFIPFIGSFIAVLIALLVYIIQSGLTLSFVWLLILLVLVQILFSNIIEPKVFGNLLKLYPVTVLLFLSLWSYIWGPIGMLLAVPITASIKIILESIGGKAKVFAKLLGE